MSPTPKQSLKLTPKVLEVYHAIQNSRTHTVCMEANCPNIGHCFQKGKATFLLLGDTCTRKCSYCGVKTAARGAAPEPGEIDDILELLAEHPMEHLVLTSVTRDDLEDGGAAHFALAAEKIVSAFPQTTVELLTPDLTGNEKPVMESKAAILAHNLETVPRLFPSIRSGSSFDRSLALLATYASSGKTTKTGLIAGLGETLEELEESIFRAADAGVFQLTVGQYLPPSQKHPEPKKIYHEEEWSRLRETTERAGIAVHSIGTFSRSSYLDPV